MMTGNIEIVQALVAAVGLIANVWSLWNAYCLLPSAQLSKRPAAVRFMAVVSIRRELIRLSIQVGLIAEAIYGFTARKGIEAPFLDIFIVHKFTFMYVAIMSAMQAVFERYDREIVLLMVSQEEKDQTHVGVD